MSQDLEEVLREAEELLEKIGSGVEQKSSLQQVLGEVSDRAQQQLDSIIQRPILDPYYSYRRALAYLYFDAFLDECRNGRCPRWPQNLRLLQCLVDISVAGYVLTREAWLQQQTQSSRKPQQRDSVEGIISMVVNCDKTSELDESLFKQDTDQVLNRSVWERTYDGARNRKAYWTYMKYSPQNDPFSDYCGACYYIDKLHRISSKENCTPREYNSAIELVSSHEHMTNALDLFRLCIVRRKLR